MKVQISNQGLGQEIHKIYFYFYIDKANCTSCVHHVSTVHHLAKCMSCYKATVMITEKVHCFHDCMYITLILLLWDLSTLCRGSLIYIYTYISIYIYIKSSGSTFKRILETLLLALKMCTGFNTKVGSLAREPTQSCSRRVSSFKDSTALLNNGVMNITKVESF